MQSRAGTSQEKKNNAKKIVQYFISQVVTLSKEKDQFRLSIYQEKKSNF